MRSVKSLLAAGAATLISSMAFAADMPIAAPPPMYAPPAPPADFGGWYLRGDIGMTNQSAKRIDSATAADVPDDDGGARLRLLAAVRPRRRLSLQQLVPRRRDRPVSRQGQSARLGQRHFSGADFVEPTTTPAASPSGSSWPTPMSISAPGGASPRSSAPVSAAPTTSSAASGRRHADTRRRAVQQRDLLRRQR